MSTVLPTDVDDPGAPIGSADELVAYLQSAEKPRAQFRVGTEHEKFGFLLPDHAPLPFDGPRGIEALLKRIAAEPPAPGQRPFIEVKDGPRVIAALRDDASITLEPGGQLELSGAPLRSVHDTRTEVIEHLRLLKRLGHEQGIGFIGMGFHPTATWDALPLVPKERYGVMADYMPQVGARGLDMMKRTATVQANYDWLDERDMVKSYQAALVVSPLIAALFASSPFVEGKPSGAVSERQRVWADTDGSRSGFPAAILAADFSYERYVQWALDVPMYFVRRDGKHKRATGASFRTFMTDGLVVEGVRVRATLRDFADHLTTIFPEVRLKRVLEVRAADCGPVDQIVALPALYKGLLYDEVAKEGALALMDGASPEELTALRADVATRGFGAVYRGQTVLRLSERLLELSFSGLARLGDKNERGEHEGVLLQTLVERVQRGQTFAEDLLDRFHGPWGGDISRIWDELDLFRGI